MNLIYKMNKRNDVKNNFVILLLLFGSLVFSYPGRAQEKKLLFSKEDLITRIQRIIEKYSTNISYDNNLIKGVEVPQLDVTSLTVEQAISQSISATNFTYKRFANGSFAIIQKPNKQNPSNIPPGTVKGRIVEAETSEPLPGTTVKILNTNHAVIADENGYYAFPRLPAGKYTIEASFMSFSTEMINVTIVENKENTYDIRMSSDAKALSEVTVSAVRKQRSSVPHMTEKLLVNEIKQLSVVASGISSEQISKSADRNAAQAVQRVSGVSIVDDKFVIVRGLNPRYNLTYLNDNVAPSTEVNNRSFALDLIPSRVIDKIMVYKTASPENQADATGGVVKIYTKDAKAVKHLDIDFQLGYREGTTFSSNFLTYSGGKTDFLGFDDGTRALPAAVPGYGSLLLADLLPSEYAKVFNSTLYYGKKTTLPNMQMTINYYDAWQVFGKTLSSLTSFSYKNDNQRSQVKKQEGAPWRSVGLTDKTSSEDKNTNTVQVNLLQNFTLTLNDYNKIFFKNFFLQQGIDATVVRTSHSTFQDASSASLNKDITLSYNQRFLYAGNLGGEHSSSNKIHNLQWNVGYNYSRQETPDQRVIRLRGIMPEYSYGNEALNWWARGYNPTSSEDLSTVPLDLGIISRLWSKNSEGVYNASLDYKFKPTKWLTLMAGTFHQWKKRELSRRIYTVHEGNVDPTASILNIYKGNYVDANLVRFREQDLPRVWSQNYLNDNYTGLYVVDRTSGADMYVGTEQNNSGYLAFTLTPYKWVEVHGGARYEYNRQKIAAAIPARNSVSEPINNPVLIDNPSTDWLPSVNLSLKPTERWIFRSAYGKTVNRTEFREVSPFKELDFENNTVLQGNPDLKSASVTNYDFRLEFYPDINKGNAVSLGVFYKDIINPIERVNTSNRITSLFPSVSYDNATSATVKGLEVELRKSLDFIPLDFFRDLSVVANLSLMDSKAIYENLDATSNIIAERPLQGQAPYLLNAGLYYDNAARGSKVSVIYNYVAENIYAVGLGEKYNSMVDGPEYRGSLIELPRHLLDFSYTQRISKGMQLKLTVQNILNSKIEIAEDFNFTNKYEPLVEIADPNYKHPIRYEGDNIASSYRPGRYFNLSFSYSF